jgi:hypothetical protein
VKADAPKRRKPGAGRPKGSIVALSADPQRFALATWCAFCEMGLDPYPAGYLVVGLFESGKPITAESIDEALVIMSSGITPATMPVVRRADRMVRKARQVFPRASESERAWLAYCSGAIRALVQFAAQANWVGVSRSLDLLMEAGWRDVIQRITRRLDAVLRSDMREFEGKLSRAALHFLTAQQDSSGR